jgi:uncharacterized membrane protein YraQ (UPF0718 family)
MSDSCHQAKPPACCPTPKQRFDWLLWGSLGATLILYAVHLMDGHGLGHDNLLARLAVSVFDLLNTIWWGLALGILMVALLSRIPREFVLSAFGRGNSVTGILRATAAGVLLDLCSHGILMVGAKLYERGASAGQVLAFLIASPWNSFSLTLILVALIGLPWTLLFIALSMLVAITTGIIFDRLVTSGTLPGNPHAIELPADFHFWRAARAQWAAASITRHSLLEMLVDGVKDSRMVLRWILFGVLLASVVRTFVSTDQFATYFGPSLLGLAMTLIAATVIEVCSEGSTPIAADLLTRAGAPGNSFAFLMTGVTTDYTEVMVLKDTTRSWKIALFMPLIAVPQVVIIAWLIN